MAMKFEIVGNDFPDIIAQLGDLAPTKTREQLLDAMGLEELFLYTDQRAQKEGYEFTASKISDKSLSPAERRKEEARAKLRGDLEGSVKTEKVSTPEEDAQPDVAEAPQAERAAAATAKKAKTNGAKTEAPEQLKERCVMRLQELFASGKKAAVKKILADFGEGAKNFHGVPVEAFGDIEKAIEGVA